MQKLRVKFLIQYIRVKTIILNAVFWPYIYFDFEELMRKGEGKTDKTKRLPE